MQSVGQAQAEILVVVGRDLACYNVNEIHQKTHQQGSKLSIHGPSWKARRVSLGGISGQNRFVQQHSLMIQQAEQRRGEPNIVQNSLIIL